jgi:hypothetical protein
MSSRFCPTARALASVRDRRRQSLIGLARSLALRHVEPGVARRAQVDLLAASLGNVRRGGPDARVGVDGPATKWTAGLVACFRGSSVIGFAARVRALTHLNEVQMFAIDHAAARCSSSDATRRRRSRRC